MSEIAETQAVACLVLIASALGLFAGWNCFHDLAVAGRLWRSRALARIASRLSPALPAARRARILRQFDDDLRAACGDRS